MISIGGFIRNDQWIYSKQRIRIRRWGDWLINSSLTIQGRNMTYTQNRSKNLLWQGIRIFVLFLFYSDNSLSLLQFPISAMPLPKIKQFFFSFSFYFDNAIATNQLQQFFSLLFLQCHCHKFIPTFSPLYFGNTIATN